VGDEFSGRRGRDKWFGKRIIAAQIAGMQDVGHRHRLSKLIRCPQKPCSAPVQILADFSALQ
jgi:hypothetical protein